MPSTINNFKTISDFDVFLKDVILHVGEFPAGLKKGEVEVGTFGGRKFKNAKGEEFTMNEVVRKLADVTEKTVKQKDKNIDQEMVTLDKVIKDLKELDTVGYKISRDKETISIFQRILTTIRQGFGISEKVRKNLYKDIETLQKTVSGEKIEVKAKERSVDFRKPTVELEEIEEDEV